MALLQRRLQLVNSVTEQSWEDAAIKVAFATSDMRHVDQHFGAAETFAIYMVDAGHSRLLEASKFGVATLLNPSTLQIRAAVRDNLSFMGAPYKG